MRILDKLDKTDIETEKMERMERDRIVMEKEID